MSDAGKCNQISWSTRTVLSLDIEPIIDPFEIKDRDNLQMLDSQNRQKRGGKRFLHLDHCSRTIRIDRDLLYINLDIPREELVDCVD